MPIYPTSGLLDTFQRANQNPIANTAPDLWRLWYRHLDPSVGGGDEPAAVVLPHLSLRNEIVWDKGRLVISRIGKRDFVVLGEVRELLKLCRVEPSGHGFTTTRRAAPGSSAMEPGLSALDALNRNLGRQKSNSGRT